METESGVVVTIAIVIFVLVLLAALIAAAAASPTAVAAQHEIELAAKRIETQQKVNRHRRESHDLAMRFERDLDQEAP